VSDAPIISIVDDDASVRRSFLRVLHMNRLSGFDLYDRLTVPVVFITGHDDAATLSRIQSSNAAGHLRKPFDRMSALDTIQRAVAAPGGRAT
jgi:FixJ family two-component response regulator